MGRPPRCRSESIPTCCGIQLGSSWPIRVWILGRCNTISLTRTSSIRFDIANFLLSGSAISGRTRLGLTSPTQLESTGSSACRASSDHSVAFSSHDRGDRAPQLQKQTHRDTIGCDHLDLGGARRENENPATGEGRGSREPSLAPAGGARGAPASRLDALAYTHLTAVGTRSRLSTGVTFGGNRPIGRGSSREQR